MFLLLDVTDDVSGAVGSSVAVAQIAVAPGKELEPAAVSAVNDLVQMDVVWGAFEVKNFAADVETDDASGTAGPSGAAVLIPAAPEMKCLPAAVLGPPVAALQAKLQRLDAAASESGKRLQYVWSYLQMQVAFFLALRLSMKFWILALSSRLDTLEQGCKRAVPVRLWPSPWALGFTESGLPFLMGFLQGRFFEVAFFLALQFCMKSWIRVCALDPWYM